jgi:hypothetical protein
MNYVKEAATDWQKAVVSPARMLCAENSVLRDHVVLVALIHQSS